MREIRLCHVDELDEPGSLEFEVACDDEGSTVFVVKLQDRVSAYINRCPHTGVPLNWLPDQFLDYSQQLIQCSLHGAQFRPQDGYCVWGPCQGQSLKALPVEIRQQQVYISCS